MQLKKIVSFAVVALLAVGASLIACSSSSTDAASCDQVCATVTDCGSTTCLAECISIRTTCNEASAAGKSGAISAFNDFAACGPAIMCEPGSGYVVTNCPLPQIELSTQCQATGMSIGVNPGTDAGVIFPGKDSGTDGPIIVIGDSGGGDDSGDDSGECGVCQSDCVNACNETCTGGDCQSSDDSGGCGVCQSNCENECGECTGGDCVSSDDTGGCGACGTDCVDECGDSCTGGDCQSSDDSGCGTCGSDCEDDCGDSCTGGDCCESTGCGACTNCSSDPECTDNCGNACC